MSEVSREKPASLGQNKGVYAMHFVQKCRGCGADLVEVLLDLGASPLANSYISIEQIDLPELYIPLLVMVCGRCQLVQQHHNIDREAIFGDYAYQSSWSTSYVEHARTFADTAVERLDLTPASQVVEVASNDGYLLQWFVERGIPALGVEPAANIAALAEQRGIPTRVEFFGTSCGHRLRDEIGPADLIVANNVLAHVDDLHDFVGGVSELLAPTGRASVEFPHLMRLLDEVEFDTIYHEHVSYLSLLALEPVLAEHGLAVVDVEELAVHGGSLRIWVAHRNATTEWPSVERVRGAEVAAGLADLSTYARFAPTVCHQKRRILSHLIDQLDRGRRVAAYGAPAKGNTLLNYCGIGPDMIEFTVDRNPDKQGTLLPGSRIPVRDPEVLTAERPDVVVVLPWNLVDEVVPVVAAGRWGGETHVLRPGPAVVG
jgi:SAM-dependent methyltransferase